jgi:hypothetical protein
MTPPEDGNEPLSIEEITAQVMANIAKANEPKPPVSQLVQLTDLQQTMTLNRIAEKMIEDVSARWKNVPKAVISEIKDQMLKVPTLDKLQDAYDDGAHFKVAQMKLMEEIEAGNYLPENLADQIAKQVEAHITPTVTQSNEPKPIVLNDTMTAEMNFVNSTLDRFGIKVTPEDTDIRSMRFLNPNMKTHSQKKREAAIERQKAAQA